MTDHGGAALVIRHDDVQGALLEVTKEEADAAATEFWKASRSPVVNSKVAEGFARRSRELYDMLVRSVTPWLEGVQI